MGLSASCLKFLIFSSHIQKLYQTYALKARRLYVPVGFLEIFPLCLFLWQGVWPLHVCSHDCPVFYSPGKWTFRSKAGRNHRAIGGHISWGLEVNGSVKSICSFESSLSWPFSNVGHTLCGPAPRASPCTTKRSQPPPAASERIASHSLRFPHKLQAVIQHWHFSTNQYLIIGSNRADPTLQK